jgi:hypothetical protein
MGACFSFRCLSCAANACECCDPVVRRVALKLPNGTRGIQYDDATDAFVPCDINEWLKTLFTDAAYWLVYNDETKLFREAKRAKGHCKGIVAWNHEHIAWLIHSVPNFPRAFDGASISPLEPSEHIYGQSFCYLRVPYASETLDAVLTHVSHMDADVYLHKLPSRHVHRPRAPDPTALGRYDFGAYTHLCKPPALRVDVYRDLQATFTGTWYVQTWRRGHPVEYAGIHDVYSLRHGTTQWTSTQDHSKWGVSNTDLVWFGDLNRMSSQESRGGGGLVFRDRKLAAAMRALVLTWVTGGGLK